MNPEIRIFDSAESMADTLAGELKNAVDSMQLTDGTYFLALSGGLTPKVFFRRLARDPYRSGIDWHKVNFFWGDERCVPPDHSDSNYGMTREALLEHIDIPPENVHRIRGEDSPVPEAARYDNEIREFLPATDGQPVFDRIFLGLGMDGHTASLFPNAYLLNETSRLCALARHPKTEQSRITLTLPILNAARRVTFLVTGSGKADIVKKIVSGEATFPRLPAARVHPHHGRLEWYLDRKAAAKI